MFKEVSDDLQCSAPREYAVESDDMLERDLEDLGIRVSLISFDLINYWSFSTSARDFEDELYLDYCINTADVSMCL